MSPRRGLRIVSGWIALLAILLVTLAPAATSAWSASSGLPWDRICSASNLEGAKSGRPDSPAMPQAFDHCPYCALHAELAPPPDPHEAGAGVAPAFHALPAAFLRAPRGNAVWASAQPRAPPRFV
jgi:hypothetical protein